VRRSAIAIAIEAQILDVARGRVVLDTTSNTAPGAGFSMRTHLEALEAWLARRPPDAPTLQAVLDTWPPPGGYGRFPLPPRRPD
jgi:hypothetical protein